MFELMSDVFYQRHITARYFTLEQDMKANVTASFVRPDGLGPERDRLPVLLGDFPLSPS